MLSTLVFGWLQPGEARGQVKHVPEGYVQDEVCPDLHVRQGHSLLMDCAFSPGAGHTFEWTSEDPAWLDYISALDKGTPSFHAPSDLAQARTFSYYRIQRSVGGAVIGRTAVRVVVYPEWTGDCLNPDGAPLKGQARAVCDEASAEARDVRGFQAGGADEIARPAFSQEQFAEPLDLRCVQSVTVEASGESIVSCTSTSSAGDLLQYTARFDWPPYSETVVLEGGDLEYTIRAPAIADHSAVRRLELTAEDHLTGETASQEIEVHVVNSGPVLHCHDLVVQEGDRVRIQCVASGSASIRYQILHAAHRGDIPGGVLMEVPAITAPEVDADTTITIIVRAIDRMAGRVAQQEISVGVRDADPAGGVPVSLSIECEPPMSEVYEGDPDIRIECTITSGLDANLDWTWAAKGAAPLELLRVTDPYSPGTATFEVPESVEGDAYFAYSGTASHGELGVSNPFDISITVLSRPELALDCESKVTVFVGDPPHKLQCEVSNDKDLELEYTWEWSPATLLEDADTAMPLFNVPAEQRKPSVEYRYWVTVTAQGATSDSELVEVTVVNPDASRAFHVAVSTTGMDLGRLGSAGTVRLDPDTEQLSGFRHGGAVNTGRMLIAARDSLVLALELVRPVILNPSDTVSGAAETLVLAPEWSYSETCTTLAPEALPEFYVLVDLKAGDCRLLRFGGEVDLSGAAPGTYTGEMTVLLTMGGLDESYAVPVTLTVEDERRVVTIGPEGASFGPEAESSASLSPAQNLRIHPLVAALGTGDMEGVLEVSNPSVVPLEVSVTTEFGYLEALAPGSESVVVADAGGSPLGNLADRITLHPGVFMLLPGQSRQVRYAIDSARRGSMGDRGYAALLGVTAAPLQYVADNRIPASVSASGAASVTASIPAVYIPGESRAPLSAVLETISNGPPEGNAVTLLIETAGEPFAGEVVVRGAGGAELGRSDLLVYTRSRVRVPLSGPAGASFTLQFVPGTDAPAPRTLQLSTVQ